MTENISEKSQNNNNNEITGFSLLYAFISIEN